MFEKLCWDVTSISLFSSTFILISSLICRESTADSCPLDLSPFLLTTVTDTLTRDMCACENMGRYNVIRLGFVAAQSALKNEVVYAPPSTPKTSTTSPVIVFFGGDVQDYPEVMTAHKDHGRYVEWSLTGTASLLAAKFPSHHVLVVKPSRMEWKTFSCYDNFVSSDRMGAPTHNPGMSALTHLKDIISEGLKNAAQARETENQSVTEETSMSVESAEDITLIGFSKGCVVLNQLITEFHFLKVFEYLEDNVLHNFIQKVHNMYWLDGGHAGGSNTWITDSSILNTLASHSHINVHVHVTPYQCIKLKRSLLRTALQLSRTNEGLSTISVNSGLETFMRLRKVEDEQRPWIRSEWKSFCKILQRANCKINNKLHFQDEPPSLLSHFRLLNEFV